LADDADLIKGFLQGTIPVKFLGDDRLCRILAAAVTRRLDNGQSDLKDKLLKFLKNKKGDIKGERAALRSKVVALFKEEAKIYNDSHAQRKKY
jgi:hypothetical protein